MKRVMELTEEQKTAICEQYKDKSFSVTEIAERYGIMRGEVAHIAVERGAEPRCKNKYGTKYNIKQSNAKTCPKCHKSIDIKGAKFCCYCGSDIRSNAELLIERMEKVASNFMAFPVSVREELVHLFADIEVELKKGGSTK